MTLADDVFKKEFCSTKRHWLYSSHFRVSVTAETDCTKCVHRVVCDKNYEKRCANFYFGNSDRWGGCQSCTNRFGRFDKDKVLCFYCPYFSEGC
jgi:hypothetical protein